MIVWHPNNTVELTVAASEFGSEIERDIRQVPHDLVLNLGIDPLTFLLIGICTSAQKQAINFWTIVTGDVGEALTVKQNGKEAVGVGTLSPVCEREIHRSRHLARVNVRYNDRDRKST